jgi:hypothetical protein
VAYLFLVRPLDRIVNDSRPTPARLIAWCVFAAVAGVCCLVLPPFLTKDALSKPAYGWPLIPWFALAWTNVHAAASMVCFFGLGLILGVALPRWWWLLALLAAVFSPVLLTINILHDWTHDATSHNMFPFEFLIYAFICLPAVVGAFLGFLVRRLLQKPQAV